MPKKNILGRNEKMENSELNMEKIGIPALQAAVLAGDAIMEVYRTDFGVDYKSDRSPLTLADQRAHDIITKCLLPLEIPILSEEGKNIPYAERKNWDTLWIVDPLDGTKEFVKKNDEFTVNIALVHDQTPVFGVIYVPVKNMLYFGRMTEGAYLLDNRKLLERLSGSTADLPALEEVTAAGRRLPVSKPGQSPYVIVGSRSHLTPEVEAFVDVKKQHYDQVEFISAGSSLKFCLVAEGKAAIYPRLGPTMEWDTAAGQAIAAASGAHVYCHDTGKPLLYNRPDLLNPWFVVEAGKGV
jgi:3'(2'), 5'-bisphosphate nucleotidase